MSFAKIKFIFLVLIGFTLTAPESYALEVCSQKACKKAESQNLQVIAENLNRIFGFLQQGDYIQLCKSDREMTKCVSSDISHLILGGLVLPMRGKINGYKVEKIGDEISFVADAGKLTTCARSELEFSIEDDEIILKNKSKYYCNWAAVGNVMSYTELKLKKVDLDRLHFYGRYKIFAVGTAVGGGEGVGSFQVIRGDSVITAAGKKYGVIDLFKDLSLQAEKVEKKIEGKKDEADQTLTEKPKSVDQQGNASDGSTPITQDSRPAELNKQEADFFKRGEIDDDKDSSAARNTTIDQTSGEVYDPAKQTTEKAPNEDLPVEKRPATGKSAPAEKRMPSEKKSLADKRSPNEKRAATEKARTDVPVAEKRASAEKAEPESQIPESGRSSSSPPSKNEGKPTKPTVRSIIDL
jgi:hypothetical protein